MTTLRQPHNCSWVTFWGSRLDASLGIFTWETAYRDTRGEDHDIQANSVLSYIKRKTKELKKWCVLVYHLVALPGPSRYPLG